MDIEQLKLILETLQMAGQGTSTLVLVWLAVDVVKTALVCSVSAAGIYFIYRLIRMGLFESRMTLTLHDLSGYWSSADVNNKAITLLRKHWNDAP